MDDPHEELKHVSVHTAIHIICNMVMDSVMDRGFCKCPVCGLQFDGKELRDIAQAALDHYGVQATIEKFETVSPQEAVDHLLHRTVLDNAKLDQRLN